MFVRQALNWLGRAGDADVDAFVDRRSEDRRPVFREAVLTLEERHKVRAVITNLSSRGARVEFSARVDLPFRIVISEPTLNLKCCARIIWQRDGAAGLEFQLD